MERHVKTMSGEGWLFRMTGKPMGVAKYELVVTEELVRAGDQRIPGQRRIQGSVKSESHDSLEGDFVVLTEDHDRVAFFYDPYPHITATPDSAPADLTTY